MRNTLILARKELRSSLDTPVAYLVVVLFLVSSSVWLFFIQRFFLLDSASLRPYFSFFPAAFAILAPALTMRSWAEERRSGTDELLLTLPFSERELVLGKFLASYGLLAAALALTLPLPVTLWPLGSFDAGVVLSEYLGAALLGAASIALGQLMSSLSRNQVSAFLGSVAVLLSASFADKIGFALALPGPIVDFLNSISLSFRFESFARGAPDTRDIAFYLCAAAVFLILNVRVVLFRKWK